MKKACADAGVAPPPEPPSLPGLAGSRTGAQRVMHYADNTLAKRPYFAGNPFTAADIMMHFAMKLGAPIAAGAEFNTKELLARKKDYSRRFSERAASSCSASKRAPRINAR